AIKPISEHFTSVAKLEGLPIGAPAEYDLSQYLHQVPGGMISNLRHQLRQVRMEDRLEQALDECVRVPADFGYPIMVTPLSQFVGSQAAINVIVGERYKEVTDQTIAYALGWWGKEGALSMNPEVKDKILNRQRAKEVAAAEPPDLTVQEVRRKLGGPGVSDEELILRWVARREDIEATYAAGPAREYLSARQPLVSLIRKLAQRTDLNRVGIQKHGFSLVLEKRACS
ncbi:MAG: biotin carboxyl carrier protein, partial [Deltaproteobacteria bacterium]|nr:biotin carboxyl carrier protein [Deltaproteobacteria bacterium]